MFGQLFETQDLAVVAFLVLLEGVLSIDNALVLGLLAKRLPEHQRRSALTYGLVGAFAFRFLAIGLAQMLLSIKVVKLVGGGYLLFIAIKYLLQELGSQASEQIVVGEDSEPVLIDRDLGSPLTEEQEKEELQARILLPVPERTEEGPASVSVSPLARIPANQRSKRKYSKFWPTVMVIEFTDIAFAVDSILAAIALVGPKPDGYEGVHPKLWVVVTGGLLGVVLMRLAAVVFIRLLERFPRFETSAYLLVSVIGSKLVMDYVVNDFLGTHALDFHQVNSPAFFAFWGLMIVCFLFGFVPAKRHKDS